MAELCEGVVLYRSLMKKFVEIAKISELDLGFAAELLEGSE